MSSECRCHTDENFCFYCEMYVPLERKCEGLLFERDKALDEIKYQVERNDKQREVYFKTEKLFLLAVKALGRIAVTFDRGEMVRIAYESLEEIKRLGEGVNK